jgi:hypothetical protein
MWPAKNEDSDQNAAYLTRKTAKNLISFHYVSQHETRLLFDIFNSLNPNLLNNEQVNFF